MLLPLSLSFFSLLATSPQQAGSLPESPGIASAHAAHEAGILEAEAEFRWDLARITQLGGDYRDAIAQAWSIRSMQLQLVHSQFHARIGLLVSLGDDAYVPVLAANQFSAQVTNPYLPLVPGRTLIYERQTSEGLERIESTTLPGVTQINGIPCRTVREYETLDGVLIEDTLNWISQRSDGSVWYLGEISRTYEDGFLVTLDGSWRYGESGAQPGILMPAAPTVGQSYRQEFQLGVAEDVAHITSIDTVVTVSGKTISDCVETVEETPIEPDDLGTKVYAEGVGVVLEIDLATGGRLELIEIRN